MIPMVDLKYQHKVIEEGLKKRLDTLFQNCNFVLGKEVFEFEEKFSEWTGQSHTVSVSSGTAALELIIRALNLPPDSEVIVPVNTFYASASCAVWAGLKVRFIDCGDDYLINLDHVEKYLSKTTSVSALIAVHLYGQMIDVNRAKHLCDKYCISLIEDAAQSHGAMRDGVRVGDCGVATAYSFFPGKNLGCYGDGGAITTNDKEFEHKLKRLRWFGADDKYTHEVIGTNAKFDTIQALVLLEKLKYIDEWNDHRRLVAARYMENLKNEPLIKLPIVHKNSVHTWHMFVVQVEDRDKLISDNKDKIGFGIHYPKPLNLQKAFFWSRDVAISSCIDNFKNAEQASTKIVSLPIHPGLSLDNVDYISEKVLEHVHSR